MGGHVWVGVVEGLGVVGVWCVVSAVSVVGRWLGVCVCGTWLCGERKISQKEIMSFREVRIELYRAQRRPEQM